MDGWISLEVLPSLAAETEKTVAEAKRLSSALGRPNVFIKVPATSGGIPAIRRLIGEGVSINITLMFNRKHYRDVANAYLGGLSDFAAKGGDLSRVHSVASFFVSRVDTLIDKRLGEKIAEGRGGRRRPVSRVSSARRASRTRRSSTRTFSRSSKPSRSPPCARRARASSDRSGRPRARRTPPTRISFTSRTSSAPTR